MRLVARAAVDQGDEADVVVGAREPAAAERRLCGADFGRQPQPERPARPLPEAVVGGQAVGIEPIAPRQPLTCGKLRSLEGDRPGGYGLPLELQRRGQSAKRPPARRAPGQREPRRQLGPWLSIRQVDARACLRADPGAAPPRPSVHGTRQPIRPPRMRSRPEPEPPSAVKNARPSSLLRRLARNAGLGVNFPLPRRSGPHSRPEPSWAGTSHGTSRLSLVSKLVGDERCQERWPGRRASALRCPWWAPRVITERLSSGHPIAGVRRAIGRLRASRPRPRLKTPPRRASLLSIHSRRTRHRSTPRVRCKRAATAASFQ